MGSSEAGLARLAGAVGAGALAFPLALGPTWFGGWTPAVLALGQGLALVLLFATWPSLLEAIGLAHSWAWMAAIVNLLSISHVLRLNAVLSMPGVVCAGSLTIRSVADSLFYGVLGLVAAKGPEELDGQLGAAAGAALVWVAVSFGSLLATQRSQEISR